MSPPMPTIPAMSNPRDKAEDCSHGERHENLTGPGEAQVEGHLVPDENAHGHPEQHAPQEAVEELGGHGKQSPDCRPPART